MGCVSLPADKLQKLGECISTALRGKYCDRLDLHKICGLLQWLLKLFPAALQGLHLKKLVSTWTRGVSKTFLGRRKLVLKLELRYHLT